MVKFDMNNDTLNRLKSLRNNTEEQNDSVPFVNMQVNSNPMQPGNGFDYNVPPLQMPQPPQMPPPPTYPGQSPYNTGSNVEFARDQIRYCSDIQETVYPDEDAEKYLALNTYEKEQINTEKQFKRRKTRITATICFIALYAIFLLIGVLNTTIINGKPQMITPTIKSQREVYKSVYKGFEELNSYGTFGGINEINEMKMTQNYSEKATYYAKTIKELTAAKTSWNNYYYRTNDDDLLNTEMVDMYQSLIDDQIYLLEKVVQYYKACGGYSSEQDYTLTQMEKEIITLHNAYSNKIVSYTQRMDDIKIMLMLNK